MKPIIRVAVIGVVGSLAFAGPKVASDMPHSTANGTVDVIVQYKSFAGSRNWRSDGRLGDSPPFSQYSGNSYDRAGIDDCKAWHRTRKWPISRRTGPLSGFLDITTQTVNANPLWSAGWDGTGVGIAVIDSGVALKQDLAAKDGSHSRVVFSESFVPGEDGSDQYGHGTHVAGIVAANGAQSTGPNFTHTFKGVAPNANIVNLRVLDANGNGQESDVIAAIDEAIALKDKYNIRVINLSLGHPVYESFTAGSTVPGRGGRLEGGNHRGSGGRKYGPRQLARHAWATRPSIRRATTLTSSPSAP